MGTHGLFILLMEVEKLLLMAHRETIQQGNNGLFTNLEQGRGADTTRSMHLDDPAEKRLMNKID